MTKRALLPSVAIILFFMSDVIHITGAVFASQQNVVTPWTIVERCLPSPIEPDENWSFEGEILLQGWGGIHAVSAALNVPYVVYWRYGSLSPNGNWILNQEEVIEAEQLTGGGPMGRYHFYYGDITAEEINTGAKVVFPWESYISMTSRPYLFGPAGLIWLDERHFASFYGTNGRETRIGNLDTSEIMEWDGVSLEDHELSISPDQTRLISYAKLYALPHNTLLQDAAVGTNYDLQSSVWTSDSSMFIDVVQETGSETSALTLFDRNGNVLAVPFVGHSSRIYTEKWSPLNDMFAFSASLAANSYENRAFIADIKAQVIYDLCADNSQGWAWSPDGSKFATIFGRNQQPVTITDLNDWQSVIVAYHTGSVLLWRTP